MDYWIWAAIGIVLVAAEAIVPGVFIIWFGVASIGLAAITLVFPETSAAMQILAFAVLAIAGVALQVFWFKRHPIASDAPLLNQGARSLVGRTVVVSRDIVNGRGSVKVGDTVWSAEGPDVAAGLSVTIVDVDGSLLKVEPVAKPGGTSPA